MVKTVYCRHDRRYRVDRDCDCECGYCEFCGGFVESCAHDDPAEFLRAVEEDQAAVRRDEYRRGFAWAAAQTWVSRRYALEVLAVDARYHARNSRTVGRCHDAAYSLGLARGYRSH
jgi:hypothetical protein